MTTTGRYFDDGWRCAMVREGRTKLHVTYSCELGVIHRAVDRTEIRSIRPVPYKGQPYPVPRMVRKLREIARARGITESAKAELSRATQEAA